MTLPKVTVNDVLSWGPCHSKQAVHELAAPLGERFDALSVLRASHITAADRLWAVLREEMIPAPILHEFACRTAEWALVLVALGGAEIDLRSVEAIATKRRWVRGQATDAEIDAAWSAADAARSAARSAVWKAAWSAARSAARSAADAARSAAWSAACNAAWSAADAARSAAWSAVCNAAWSAADAAWSAARSAADDVRVGELIGLLEARDG